MASSIFHRSCLKHYIRSWTVSSWGHVLKLHKAVTPTWGIAELKRDPYEQATLRDLNLSFKPHTDQYFILTGLSPAKFKASKDKVITQASSDTSSNRYGRLTQNKVPALVSFDLNPSPTGRHSTSLWAGLSIYDACEHTGTPSCTLSNWNCHHFSETGHVSAPPHGTGGWWWQNNF